MKTTLFLIAFLLGMVVNAQTGVTGVIPFEAAKNIYLYNGQYAAVYDIIDTNDPHYGDSVGKIFDANGNQIGNDYHFDKYTSSGDTNTSNILFDNQYVYIIGGVKTDVTTSWNKIVKYDRSTSSISDEKMVYGILPTQAKLIDGILYLDIKLTPNYDFLSSGWDSVITYHGGSEEHNITTFDNPTWASYLGSSTSSIEDMVKTADNNIFVQARNNHYWKIDSSNGNNFNRSRGSV